MKFNCGKSRKERIERLEKWHRWFAWKPIKIGPQDCRWLEFVERKGHYACFYDGCWWNWVYRTIDDTPNVD